MISTAASMPDTQTLQPKASGEAREGALRRLASLASELQNRVPSKSLKACSLVHLRHPLGAEQLGLLAELDAPAGSVRIPSLPRLFSKWGICLLWAVYESLYLAVLKLTWGPAAFFRRPRNVDVLFKTWCVDRDLLDKTDDFYLGSLPADLQKRGLRTLVLCGDARSDEGRLALKLRRPWDGWRIAAKILTQRPLRYYPEVLLLPLGAPLRIAFEQLSAGLRLRKLAQSSQRTDLALAAAFAGLDCLRPFTAQTRQHYDIARKAVKRFAPKAFVSLYEGQPWETLSRLGARAASAECRLGGFQHTILMRHALALLEPPASAQPKEIPDVVLCTGRTSREMLEKNHAAGSRLIDFGSFRRKPIPQPAPAPRPQQRTLLVLPEGISAPAIELFDFAMSAARLRPDYRVLFRCHPVLPFEKVRPLLRESIEAFPMIEISTDASIDRDFARSSAILYSGSSSVLYAILHGLKPFYYRNAAADDTDPLFALRGWREVVRSPAELGAALERFPLEEPQTVEQSWREARDYVDGYVQPVNETSLDAFKRAFELNTVRENA
jgi:hypothetical protein